MDTTVRQRQRALRALAFFGLGCLLTLALLPLPERNLLGLCGRTLAAILAAAFGHGAWLFPVFLLESARVEFFASNRAETSRRARPIAMAGVLALVCTACHLIHNAGGRLGAVLGDPLFFVLGLGAYLVCAIGLVAIAARWAALSPLRAIGAFLWRSRHRLATAWRVGTRRERTLHARTSFELQAPPELVIRSLAPTSSRSPSLVSSTSLEREFDHRPESAGVAESDAQSASPAEYESNSPAASRCSAPAAAGVAETESNTIGEQHDRNTIDSRSGRAGVATLDPYRLPPSALLDLPARSVEPLDPIALKATALKLAAVLSGFGIEGNMDGCNPGPVVTIYEYAPKVGTKLAKIASLAQELSMSLERVVRIIAPLPGTARVGIEVPHARAARQVVYLRELVDDDRWLAYRGNLPLALGKDPSGTPVYCDLAAAPHLLVAGATGAGKSTGLSSMLTSLVLRCSPHQLRLILIDPKLVELASFADLPHLLVPVVTETRPAVCALLWVLGEMERRYRLFAAVSVRNLDGYNSRDGSEPLPRIVVVVDEFADLMMAARDKRVETTLARLAGKARAAGIHLIIATQRPSVDVITGLIKANFLSRIAFRVAQRVDSKVILDRKGAEYLLGSGDMLCALPGHLDLVRVHGAYVSEDDLKIVCAFARAQREPEYNERILAGMEAPGDDGEAGEEVDALYDRAVAFVAAEGACSTSAIQREFNVGYNRAAKLVEAMEKDGVVGPAVRAGGKREVLVEAR